MAGYDDTPGNRPSPFPFEIIDLTTHADSKLLQPGAKLTSGLADRYWGTADAIAALQPKTLDGLQMKALVALGMLSNGQRKLDKIGVKGFSMWGGCVSIVKRRDQGFRHERRP
jgi:hypothetical protein